MAETNQYSTLAVSPARRFESWREVVCRHCLSADSKPSSQSDFEGVLQFNEIGPLDLTTLSSPLHHLRSDPAEDIWLGLTLDGHGEIEQHTRKASLTAGNLFLYDATQPFRFSLGGTENHLIRIPRPLLAQRLPRIGEITALVLDEARPGVIPLRQMIGQAASSVALLEGEGISQRYSNTIIDLLVLSLELQDLKTTHQELDLYGRMMSYIQQHLTEPELSIETIAVAHHVSTRTVTRAFARHQKSPVAEIWKERLNASRAAIECGQVRSVSQAALEFGFTDFSHFSHAFRKAFGVAPRTLLRGSGG
ncbi:AraC-like ligand-binding domain-containing protein [Pseudomonas monteilii]|uniref:AraC-like ligand-binding domain-containing protein n=1 Tax=Pseudomonas monteilii TaxID=76759 RepID=UPI001CBF379E|nr:helix-turn-helix domain-containing protein [Pseudomonas monteilii]MBZ3663966.1 helix-turn-helix domain-containing protein [Pseudomonas monteilii]MBZ3669311.1 helix-turn-helix domain-containing protein [Pseudomonas monteilii]